MVWSAVALVSSSACIVVEVEERSDTGLVPSTPVDVTAGAPVDVLAEAEPTFDTAVDSAEPPVDTGPVRRPPPRRLDVQALGTLAHTEVEVRLAGELGVAWLRPHPGPFSWAWFQPAPGQWDWRLVDAWVQLGQEAGVNLVGTLWPYADWDQAVCRPASCTVGPSDAFAPMPGTAPSAGVVPASRCMPCDIDAWAGAVSALVERYDGDGLDDASWLETPVTAWEVLNEPELASDELTFFVGSASEYAQLLEATTSAVHAACPGCEVLHGGSAGAEQSDAWWSEVYTSQGGADFNIANVHYIDGGDVDTLNVSSIGALLEEAELERPIWVTEASVPTHQDPASLLQHAVEAGASKIFVTDLAVAEAVLVALALDGKPGY